MISPCVDQLGSLGAAFHCLWKPLRSWGLSRPASGRRPGPSRAVAGTSPNKPGRIVLQRSCQRQGSDQPAIISPWSNGQTEGQTTTLKLFKPGQSAPVRLGYHQMSVRVPHWSQSSRKLGPYSPPNHSPKPKFRWMRNKHHLLDLVSQVRMRDLASITGKIPKIW